MSKNDNIAVVCKLMPLYRLGVFQKLTSYKAGLEFTMFGDTKKQAGIKTIDWSYSQKAEGEGIRWIRTKNYYYKPELLLWQTGIIRRILFSNFKVFIFEGGISHFPVWLFAILCKLMNKKVLFWTHGFKGLDRGFLKQIRILFFKYLSDGLLLYGNHQKEIMINEGFLGNKIFVIYNSLQPDLQFKNIGEISYVNVEKTKKKIFLNPLNFTIIFIGRLVPSKRVLDIFRAIKILKNDHLEVNCLVIGEGPEIDTLSKYCTLNELDEQVYFTGELYDESSIAFYFAMADLMVSPGNVGLNCMHSLGYGIPVLTHDNFCFQGPEVEAIIEGKTGGFYKYGYFDDFVEKLTFWINTKPSKEIIKKNCQKIITDTFNPQNQLNCIVKAIEIILKIK